ncbi:MAG: 50S ribosomal protein L18 [Dehalococcoidales bacterium]|jgi:large subunit ribosomal protein L18
MTKSYTRESRIRRHSRVREKIAGTETRPRLCIFRSLNHIYAQVIDDLQGRTLAAASTLDADVKKDTKKKNKTSEAELVGTLLAKRAAEKGISLVAFDRGGFKYHGRVKALAEAARKGGLKF